MTKTSTLSGIALAVEITPKDHVAAIAAPVVCAGSNGPLPKLFVLIGHLHNKIYKHRSQV